MFDACDRIIKRTATSYQQQATSNEQPVPSYQLTEKSLD